MSIQYSPELVKALMEERLREARRFSSIMDGRADLAPQEPNRFAAVRNLFRRQSPAACTC